jgi:AsmA family protein
LQEEGTVNWKRILIAGIVVVAVLVSAAWIIIATYDYNKLKPQIESAFKEATGRSLGLRGNLELRIGLTPTLSLSGASVQNATWGSRPNMAEIERFEVQLALIPLLFRRIDVKRIVLARPDILVETNPAGETNLDFVEKVSEKGVRKEKPAAGKVRLTVNEIKITDGRLTFRNGKTGKAYVLTLGRFGASARSADSPLKVDINGSYNGNAFQAKGNLVPLAAFTESTRPWPFNLTAEFAGASISLDGTIKDVPNLQGAIINISAKGKDMAGIGALLGVSIPLKGPFQISCTVTDPRPKTYEAANLKVAVAGSDLAGSLGVDLSKSRPFLKADLRSRRFDLRPIAGDEKAHPKAKAAGTRLFSASPFPLEPLELVDADVSIRAAEVFLPQLALHDLDAKASLQKGHLSVKPLAAIIGGGRLDGRLDLESREKVAHVATLVTVKQLDTGAMFKELGKADMLDGRMDARIDVSGTGGSIAGLMSGLNGMAYVTMGEGKINNRYLGLLGSDISSNILRMVNPFKKELPTTKVSCVVCGFKIEKGKAETTALVVNSDYMSVVGNGTIDLRTEGLDLSLRPVPKEGIGTGITGKLNLSLGELARPFKLAGTLSHPSLAIDVRETAVAAGKALGGLMLFGPVGIGSALVGSSGDEKQLCPLAVKAAQQGVKLKLAPKGVTGKATEGIEKGIGALGKGLKGLFGR